MDSAGSGKLDTLSVAGAAVFSALAIVLAAGSQALGLNFPVIPYLQFDFGEVAIVLAFFIFGPVPAAVSAVVEFLGLMFFGQMIPVGPLLKLFALLSTVGGLWLGSRVSSRSGGTRLGRLIGSSAAGGGVVRAAVMTIPNYYVVVFLFGVAAIAGFLQAPFSAVGIALNNSNAVPLVLLFTAVFNVAQVILVMAISYLVLRVRPVSQLRFGGRTPWFVQVLGKKTSQAPPPA